MKFLGDAPRRLNSFVDQRMCFLVRFPHQLWKRLGSWSEVYEDVFFESGFDDVCVSQRTRVGDANAKTTSRLVRTKNREKGIFLELEKIIGEEAIVSRLNALFKKEQMVTITQICDLRVSDKFKFERKRVNSKYNFDRLVDAGSRTPIVCYLTFRDHYSLFFLWHNNLCHPKVEMFRQYLEQNIRNQFRNCLSRETFRVLCRKRKLLGYTWKRLHYVLDGFSVSDDAKDLDDIISSYKK